MFANNISEIKSTFHLQFSSLRVNIEELELTSRRPVEGNGATVELVGLTCERSKTLSRRPNNPNRLIVAISKQIQHMMTIRDLAQVTKGYK